MAQCLDVACFFLTRAYNAGLETEVTNLKLQKLLYYSQCLSLALYDEPLFTDEFQAWRYGPVCPPVYRFYNDFEAAQRSPAELDTVELSNEIRDVLEEVWQYFSPYKAWDLSGMTHQEPPWLKARAGLPAEASSTAAIALEDMKTLGETWLDRIERLHPQYDSNTREAMTVAIADIANTPQLSGEEVHDWLSTVLD